jgi:hypothetical protein
MGARVSVSLAVTFASFSVGLVGASALADDTKEPKSFEAALEAAEPVGDLADRLDPLFADCKRDDDLEARQCAAVRDLALEKLKNGLFVAQGDESSLTWTPWTSGEKQLGLELNGCLACGKPIQLGDKPRFVTTRVPKSIKAGKVAGLDVGFYGVTLPDQATAARFVKQTLAKLTTQFVFRVGPVWKSGGAFEGVTFVPVAQRIFDRCTGKVYASEPPSTKPAATIPDAKLCPANAPVVDATAPEQLSREQVVGTMRALDGKVHSCYLTYKKEGSVTVRIVLDGTSGIENMQVGAPWDGTPTGECVKKAVGAASFGKFTGEKMTIIYPFMVR